MDYLLVLMVVFLCVISFQSIILLTYSIRLDSWNHKKRITL